MSLSCYFFRAVTPTDTSRISSRYIFRDTDTSLGHFNTCSFTMLGQLQLSWALGYFKGQILSRDIRPDFWARLNLINKIKPCYRGWADEFFHTLFLVQKFFLLHFVLINFCTNHRIWSVVRFRRSLEGAKRCEVADSPRRWTTQWKAKNKLKLNNLEKMASLRVWFKILRSLYLRLN